jgi:hypothetical protein
MKISFCVTFFVFFVILAINMLSVLNSSANEQPTQTLVELSGKALLWDYGSLCDFKDSKNIPEEITYMKGNFSNTGCQGFEVKQGKPAAVIISLQNDTSTPHEITIPILSKVSIKEKNGTIRYAIAFRSTSSVPGLGLMHSFLTTMTNSLKYKINPGKKLDIIFLFDSAKKGDAITLGDYSPLKIGQ